jgi:hypothetical protein
MVIKPSVLLAALMLLPLLGCGLDHAPGQSRHFPRSPDPTAGGPPLAGLFLWLEFGDETMSVNASGFVTSWRDARSRERSAIGNTLFLGTRTTAALRSPSFGTTDTFAALRCGPDPARCSYTIRDPGLQTGAPSLDGLRYSVFAVVRPAVARGDNYVVMTGGSGCNPGAGGTGCSRDTAFHIGWSGPRTLRHGHYDDDIFFDVLAGPPSVSLITARFQDGELDMGLLDPRTSAFQTRSGALSLTRSGELFVGGTPFTGPSGPSVPDWHFEGDIFAVLIYTGTVTNENRSRVESYLRNRYGPR